MDRVGAVTGGDLFDLGLGSRNLTTGSGSGWNRRRDWPSCGRFDQALSKELTNRTRWKTIAAFLAAGLGLSSAKSSWTSLKEEHAKDGDCAALSGIWTMDLFQERHIDAGVPMRTATESPIWGDEQGREIGDCGWSKDLDDSKRRGLFAGFWIFGEKRERELKGGRLKGESGLNKKGGLSTRGG